MGRVLTAAEREELAILEEFERWDRLPNNFFKAQSTVYNTFRRESLRAQATMRSMDPANIDVDKLQDVLPKPIAIRTPRRAAKTTLLTGMQLDDAQRFPKAHYPYIALTGPSARHLAWPVFKWWADKLGWQDKKDIWFNDGDMTWRVPNGANGKLWGADREDLQRNLYGGKNRIVCCDECAHWKTDLARFHRMTLQPTVADNMGVCIYAGAPGDILAGFFYDLTRTDDPSLRLPGYNIHEWATEDNPYMAIQLAMLKKQWAAEDPHYQERPWYLSQWKGLWVLEVGENVSTYLEMKNSVPEFERLPSDRYVLSLDTGYADGMAYDVLGYNPTEHQNVVRFESAWEVEQSTDQIAWRINAYRDRYSPLDIVGDPNNAQLLADLNSRYKIPVRKADKTDKIAWIRITNNGWTNGTSVLVDPHGANRDLHLDLSRMKKKYDRHTRIETDEAGNRTIVGPGTWEIDKASAPGHCFHADLYGYRYTYSFTHKLKKSEPDVGSKLWYKKIEANMKKNALARVAGARKKSRRRVRW